MILKWLLFPFSIIYASITYLRRWAYNHSLLSSYQSCITTISIGNLSMGGTGKTPHIEYLIRLLSPNYFVATLSRGYHRNSKGLILANQINRSDVSANSIGDEPMQYFTKYPSVCVAVCENRKVALVKMEQLNTMPDVVLLDDAFQHLQVTPHCHIILTEYNRPYSQDFVLPVGNLREPAIAAQQAPIILVTKTPDSIPDSAPHIWRKRLKLNLNQQLFFTYYQYLSPQPITTLAQHIHLTKETKVVAITGIAHPTNFILYIQYNYLLYYHHKFHDHHHYTHKEIIQIRDKHFGEEVVFFTTEKDLMRLLNAETKPLLEQIPLFVVPIEVKFRFNEEEKFKQIIMQYVRKN